MTYRLTDWGNVMRQLIAGNWKMNGLYEPGSELAAALAAGAEGLGCDLLVCPPATLVGAIAAHLMGSVVAVGGQDCHEDPQGAHTGDIAAPMLVDAGASWVILGHSERRANHFESDVLVRRKAAAACKSGLRPIVCVGETLAEHEQGRSTEVVGAQLAGSLPDNFISAGCVGAVAYEPVWAIGTGRTPTEQDVGTVHALIRQALVARFGEAGGGVRILYGGSVKPGNAAALLAVAEVGGALVGGASLKADDFLAIARAAHQG